MPPMQLKLTFANHDNAVNPVLLDVSDDTAIDSVRKQVMERWPASIPKPDRPADIRLFCMGKMLSSSTIGACNLPSFDFPTPVHVVGKLSPKALKAEQKAETASAAGSSCCSIM